MKTFLALIFAAISIFLWVDDNAKKAKLDKTQTALDAMTDERDQAKNDLQSAREQLAALHVALRPAATPTWFQQKQSGVPALDQPAAKVTP